MNDRIPEQDNEEVGSESEEHKAPDSFIRPNEETINN
jgi:hypothetical protein